MNDMLDSEKGLAWLWAIEAMASYKEVGPSLLHDLVQLAPALPDDLGKNTREVVALRCLEDFVAPQNGSPSNVPSSEGSKVQFNLSESCEDVLQRILQETSVSNLRVAGPELSKWDIQPFIQHKRAGMPKCALLQMKDAILDGTHPFADFLREKSGLPSTSWDDGIHRDSNNHDSVTSRPNMACPDVQNTRVGVNSDVENRNILLGDNVLPSKRDRPALAAEDVVGHFRENCNEANNADDQHLNLKKAKQNAPSANESAEQNSVPLQGRELLNDSSGTNVPVATIGHNLATEMRTVDEGRVLEDRCNESTVTKRSQQNNDNGFHKIRSEAACKAGRDEACQNLSVDNGELHKNESEVLRDAPEPSHVPASETVHKTKESKHSCEPDFQLKEPNSASCDRLRQDLSTGEADKDTSSCDEAGTSSDDDGYNNEMIDLAKKRHEFLSSQCTSNHDSMIVDWTDQNLCMRCNESGQLLVCHTNNCQLVVHEKCIGSPATFDDKGNFYCSFCVYSVAIKEYLEAKKCSSLARKELAAFIRIRSEHHPKKSNDGSNKKKSHHTCGNENEVFLENIHENEQVREGGKNEANQAETNVNEDNNQQAERSSPCNDNVNLEHIYERTDTDSSLLRVSAVEKEGEAKVVDECPSERAGGGEDEVPRKNDNVSWANTDKDLVNQAREDLGIQQEVLEGQDDASKRFVCEFNINSGDDDDDVDESTISNYCIRLREREIPCNFPGTPQSRRKKLPWAVAEEEKLKEGIQKFSDERKIPWKKILELGESVFVKGRTTVDLKDKWRNMCRGTPKSK